MFTHGFITPINSKIMNKSSKILNEAFIETSSTSSTRYNQEFSSNRRSSSLQMAGIPARAGARVGISIIGTFFKNYPYISSFLVTGMKGSFADAVAQISASSSSSDNDIENDNKFDILRNIAFIMYAGGYQGCAQYFIYNKLFPVWFGAGSQLTTVMKKVAFDLLVLTPTLCLPCAYLTKATIFNGIGLRSLKEGLKNYWHDVKYKGLVFKYWMLWGPVQSVTFSVIPAHFRIAFIAVISFFWLIILSAISSTPKD